MSPRKFFSWAAIGSSVLGGVEVSGWHPILFLYNCLKISFNNDIAHIEKEARATYMYGVESGRVLDSSYKNEPGLPILYN